MRRTAPGVPIGTRRFYERFERGGAHTPGGQDANRLVVTCAVPE